MLQARQNKQQKSFFIFKGVGVLSSLKTWAAVWCCTSDYRQNLLRVFCTEPVCQGFHAANKEWLITGEICLSQLRQQWDTLLSVAGLCPGLISVQNRLPVLSCPQATSLFCLYLINPPSGHTDRLLLIWGTSLISLWMTSRLTLGKTAITLSPCHAFCHACGKQFWLHKKDFESGNNIKGSNVPHVLRFISRTLCFLSNYKHRGGWRWHNKTCHHQVCCVSQSREELPVTAGELDGSRRSITHQQGRCFVQGEAAATKWPSAAAVVTQWPNRPCAQHLSPQSLIGVCTGYRAVHHWALWFLQRRASSVWAHVTDVRWWSAYLWSDAQTCTGWAITAWLSVCMLVQRVMAPPDLMCR